MTLDLLPLSIAGIIAILMGLFVANRVVDRLDTKLLQNLTYLLIGFSGALTLITTLL